MVSLVGLAVPFPFELVSVPLVPVWAGALDEIVVSAAPELPTFVAPESAWWPPVLLLPVQADKLNTAKTEIYANNFFIVKYLYILNYKAKAVGVLIIFKGNKYYCAFSTLNPASTTSLSGLSRMFCSISKW